jgi:hypothetical protein
MNELPEDILDWMRKLSLNHRVIACRKNLLLAFVDGTLVAEVIAATFPRLVELHNYKATSSAAVRLANWTMLNRKVLSTVKCELGEEDINKIANRDIQRGAIMKFLRLLRSKLDEYEEFYREEEEIIARQQKEGAKRLHGASSKGKVSTAAKHPKSFNAKSNSKKFPGFDELKEEATRPALAKSLQILEKRKDSKNIRNKVKAMTEGDIDTMYENIRGTLSDELLQESHEANEKLGRSLNIERHMVALREQNQEDLKQTIINLNNLHFQLDHLSEQEARMESELRATVDIEKAFRDEQKIIKAEKVVLMSKRGSAIAESLLEMIPEGKKDIVENKKLETEISRKQSKVLDGISLKIPGINESDGMDDGPESSKPAKSKSIRRKTEKGNELLHTVFSDFAEDQENGKPVLEASHRRVFDANTQRHFYFELSTGESSWSSPAEGIIKCVDDRTGKAFYTNAATKQVAWKIEDVQ